MKKILWKVQYFWHSNRYSYHQQLIDGCLCEKLRSEVEHKLDYHERKAISLMIKI